MLKGLIYNIFKNKIKSQVIKIFYLINHQVTYMQKKMSKIVK